MFIIPAIDIRGGKCVRLLMGDFQQETVFQEDPVELAKKYASSGAQCLHIVDLDAARDGSWENRELIMRMVEAVDIPVQLGGGIRNPTMAAELLSLGVHRAILGSLAMKQPDVSVELIQRHGPDRICAALDVRPTENGYQLAASGWLETVPTTLRKLLDFYTQYNLLHVLVTDVSRDGAMKGPNVALYADLMERYPNIKLQASGGVRSNEDVCELKRAGASAAIVGKALLIGAIDLSEQLGC